MALPKRHADPPGAFFVTFRTWQGRRTFQLPAACQLFVDNLLRHRSEGKYCVHAFVLMPDHFHGLLTPGDHVSLERSVQYIKGGSSHAIGEMLGRGWPVWQRGFVDHRVRDTADYEEHVAYIARNPAKAGLAEKPDEYAWCSASGRWALDGFPQRLKPGVGGVAGRHG